MPEQVKVICCQPSVMTVDHHVHLCYHGGYHHHQDSNIKEREAKNNGVAITHAFYTPALCIKTVTINESKTHVIIIELEWWFISWIQKY